MSPPVIELLYVDDDDDHDNNDDYKDDGHDNNDDLIRTTNMIDMLIIREDPNGLTPPPFGHCPNSDWTPPPPHSTGHSGALFFGPFLPFCRVVCFRKR